MRTGVDVHIYPSPFEYETRILKMTASLVATGIAERIVIIARAKPGLPHHQRIDAHRDVLRVPTGFAGAGAVAKTLMFLDWSGRTFVRLRREAVVMLNCHSLSALPVSVALKWWHGATLIYEPHELETETTTFSGFLHPLVRALERSLIGQAVGVIAVSDSIAEEYRRRYGLRNVSVVRNIPEREPSDRAEGKRLLRDRFDIPDGDIVFMYHGLLDDRRGVGWLLDAFRRIPPDRHLVLMGFGPLESDVQRAAAATPNIHFLEAVPLEDVLRYTCAADVGFALLADDCLNHRYALPNKFFQYLHCAVPVIASDLKEMAALVDRYACGWRVGGGADAIADCLSRIDRASIESRRAGAARAGGELQWDGELRALLEFYRRVALPASAPANVET
jgi:glycosyltransferase involved in cell wall biosynthesis